MARTLASNVDFYSLNSSTEGLKRYGYYKCTLTCDEPIRNGKKVTIPNLKVVMTRQGTGYTEYRLAARAGIGGSQTNICSNKTINTYGTNSPKTITVELGSPSIETLSTSVSLYVSLASTGGSSSWGNFKGKSPHVIFNGTVNNCPPANPTFTTVPSFGSVEETRFALNFGITDIESEFEWKFENDTQWKQFGSYSLNTPSNTTLIKTYTNPGSMNFDSRTDLGGISANTKYKVKIKATSALDPSLYTLYPSADGEYLEVTTFDFPKITDAYLTGNDEAADDIKNKITIKTTSEDLVLYNPLKRSLKIKLYSLDNENNATEIGSYSTSDNNKLTFIFPVAKAATAMGINSVKHTKYKYICEGTYVKWVNKNGGTATNPTVSYETITDVSIKDFIPTNMSFELNEAYCKPQWPQGIETQVSQLISLRGNNENIYINGISSKEIEVSQYMYTEAPTTEGGEPIDYVVGPSTQTLTFEPLNNIAGEQVIKDYSLIICDVYPNSVMKAQPQYSAQIDRYEIGVPYIEGEETKYTWYQYKLNSNNWVSTPVIDNSLEIIELKIRAIDTRNYVSTIQNFSFKTNSYSLPFGVVEAERTDGFGEEVKGTLAPNWFLNNGNLDGWFLYSITGSNGVYKENILQKVSLFTGVNAAKIALNLVDLTFVSDASFTITGRLIDIFGGESDEIKASIASGVPIFFIDETTQGVGANMYPNGKGYWGHEAHIDNITAQIVTLLTSTNNQINIDADILAKLKTLVAYNYYAIGDANGLYIKDNANHTFSSYTNNGNEQYNVGLKEQLRYGENSGSYNMISETIESNQGIGYGHFWNGG